MNGIIQIEKKNELMVKIWILMLYNLNQWFSYYIGNQLPWKIRNAYSKSTSIMLFLLCHMFTIWNDAFHIIIKISCPKIYNERMDRDSY